MNILQFFRRLGLPVVLAGLLLGSNSVKGAFWGRDSANNRLQLIVGESRAEGEWRAGLDAFKNRWRSGMNVEIREGRSSYWFYLPSESVPDLEGKQSDGGSVHFVIPADAGDLIFNGRVEKKTAAGRYIFEPNRDFAAQAGKLLKQELSNDDLLKLAFARINLAFIQGVHDAGVPASLDDVILLRNHGLEPGGIKAYAEAGFREPKEMTKLRSHGVTPEYVVKAKAAGYGATADELARLRNHGVTPEYLQEWKDIGYRLSAEEAIGLRNHGVQPEFGAAWKKAGFEFNHEELIRARNSGVPAEFAMALADTGAKPKMEEIVRLRNFGVSADYYREIKKQNPNYTSEEIVRFRQFGVQPDYVKAVASGRADLSAEEIIKLRSHGVPADYVSALNVPGRAPLDADTIIDLRNRGVSAETARKLRQ